MPHGGSLGPLMNINGMKQLALILSLEKLNYPTVGDEEISHGALEQNPRARNSPFRVTMFCDIKGA